MPGQTGGDVSTSSWFDSRSVDADTCPRPELAVGSYRGQPERPTADCRAADTRAAPAGRRHRASSERPPTTRSQADATASSGTVPVPS